MIVVQAFFNISVVLALLPTKGTPLPFISYGGSRLFVMLASVGVLLNVSQQREWGTGKASKKATQSFWENNISNSSLAGQTGLQRALGGQAEVRVSMPCLIGYLIQLLL